MTIAAVSSHANVKCHCSAPPSHPPTRTIEGGTNRSDCGSFSPNDGNAANTSRPLPINTSTASANAQWQTRTTAGCSNLLTFIALSHLRTFAPSQSPVPAVALIDPVAALRAKHVTHSEADDGLRLLVAKLGGEHETQRCTVLARKRPAVHLVAEQRLPVPRGRHVERVVVVVRAGDFEHACVRIRADQPQDIGEPHAAKAADHIPALDADVPRVLPYP